MKRTRVVYLSVLFILVCQIAESQDEYGKVMVSGQIGLNTISLTTPGLNNGYSSKTKDITVAPNVGYLIFQNFAAGLELLYNSNKRTVPQIGYSSIVSLSLLPFMRYYLINGKIRPYFQADAGGGFANTKSEQGSFPAAIQKSTIVTYEVKGGIELLINKHVGLDADFGYNSTTFNYKEGTKWKVTSKGTTGSLSFIIYL
jgi:hypothetical protein